MKLLTEYLSTKVKSSRIVADDNTLKTIVDDELNRLGMEADLNHIDITNCTTLKEIFHNLRLNDNSFCGDVSKWNTENITYMYYLFADCNNFNCDLSNWDVSKVKNMRNLFYNCYKFDGKGLEHWNTESLEIAGSLFCGCENFNGDVSKWKTNNITNAAYMFGHCKKFNHDLSQWNVENIKIANNMFYECENIDFSFDDWYLRECENVDGMFGYSNISVDLKEFWIPPTCSIYDMFVGCEKLRNKKDYWPRSINDRISSEFPIWKIFG